MNYRGGRVAWRCARMALAAMIPMAPLASSRQVAGSGTGIAALPGEKWSAQMV